MTRITSRAVNAKAQAKAKSKVTERRADAKRSVERILTATIELLSRSPEASMSDVAKAAGVGRVTLYSHFANREILVEAALVRAIADGEEQLAHLDLTGDPRKDLRTLIVSSWKLLAQAGAVLEAAQAALPPGRVQRLHAEPEKRVLNLIRRGQDAGVFRTDLPDRWLASVLHHLLHGAATDAHDGRLKEKDIAHLVSETVLAAYTPRP